MPCALRNLISNSKCTNIHSQATMDLNIGCIVFKGMQGHFELIFQWIKTIEGAVMEVLFT